MALIDPIMVAVVALATLSAVLCLSGIFFPLGTHADEPVKVQMVLAGPYNYYHPLLMIELARAANSFLGLTDPQSVAELGRSVSAVAYGVLVVATFTLARKVLPATAAFAAIAAAMVTPLITIHARYFKEDIYVAPFVVLALVALIEMLRAPTHNRAIALGAAIGLAGSAKYVGGLLLLPYALIVTIIFGRAAAIDARLMHAGITALTAVVLFGLVEVPGFFAADQFLADLTVQFHHAANGHFDIALPIALTRGFFHLRESLWRELGPPLTIISLLGVVTPFIATGERRRPLAVIVGFALVWYLAHEISPLKPAPDFARYMVPLATLLVILAASFVNELAERYRAGMGSAMASAAVVIAAIPACWLSLCVNVAVADDPRRLLPSIVATATGPVAVDGYAGYAGGTFVAQRDVLPSAADTTILVTSNLNYDRYNRYGAGPEQSEKTRAVAHFYAQALTLPRLDVSNGRPNLAFFNPRTTIVAMDGKAERLVPIAKMIQAIAPSLTVRWNVRPAAAM